MDIAAIAARAPVIPVLTIERLADAVPLARALVKGGLPVLEITFRTGVAVEALAAIAREVPDAIVGAGTVLDERQLRQAIDAGARFGVSPGCTPALAQAVKASGLPFLPGVQTVSEALAAREQGFSPAEVLSGRHRGRDGLAQGGRGAAGRPAVLPDRRDRDRDRAGLPRSAERRLRRRLLGGAARRRGGRRLVTHRTPRVTGRCAQTFLARQGKSC